MDANGCRPAPKSPARRSIKEGTMKRPNKGKIIVTKKVRIPERLKSKVEERLLRKPGTLTKADQIAGFIQNYYETDPEQVARQKIIKRVRELIRKR